MKVVGIDLAGKSSNPSGWCLLTEAGTDTKLLFSDEELLSEVEAVKPEVIAVDAPFWLPRETGGRVATWRNSEQLLLKRGFRPLSPALPTMQELSMRAARLVKQLRDRGYNVVEAFPRASEQILGLSKEPRKNQDEYDALLCALTGKAYLEGRSENLDGLIVPK
jgi:predicted nuclease with RNAse H fold